MKLLPGNNKSSLCQESHEDHNDYVHYDYDHYNVHDDNYDDHYDHHKGHHYYCDANDQKYYDFNHYNYNHYDYNYYDDYNYDYHIDNYMDRSSNIGPKISSCRKLPLYNDIFFDIFHQQNEKICNP